MPAQEPTSDLPRGWGEMIKSEPFVAPPEKEALTVSKPPSGGGLGKILPFLLLILLVLGIGWGFLKFVKPRLGGSLKKEITLTYWGLWESEEIMAGVIADWEKANPKIKINYINQSPREYRERLQSVLARGEGPDIFRYHLVWLPMFRNELEPLPPSVMSASEFEADFYPVVTENLRYQGGYLGIPLGVDALVLFYNKSILQAAGKSLPTTWQELRQLAVDLTTKDEQRRIQTAGAAMGITSNIEHWSDILGLMMLQNGADLANPTGPLAEDALSFYTLFKKVDRVWDETLPSSTLAFAGGKVAMVFGFSWDVFEIKRINPQLDFGIVPAPQLTPDREVNWASFWVEGVSKGSEHKNEAWQFLAYLSSEENLEKLYQAASQTRLFGEIYPRATMAESLKENSLVAPFVGAMPTAQTWYLCSRTFDNGLNDRMIRYFEDAVNGVVGGKSAADALRTTAQGVSQLTSQYGLTSSSY